MCHFFFSLNLCFVIEHQQNSQTCIICLRNKAVIHYCLLNHSLKDIYAFAVALSQLKCILDIYIYYHFYISYSSPLFLLPSHTALFNQILFELVLNVPILAKSSQCFLASSFHSSSLRLSPIRFGRKGTRLQEWEITQISKLLYQRKS